MGWVGWSNGMEEWVVWKILLQELRGLGSCWYMGNMEKVVCHTGGILGEWR